MDASAAPKSVTSAAKPSAKSRKFPRTLAEKIRHLGGGYASKALEQSVARNIHSRRLASLSEVTLAAFSDTALPQYMMLSGDYRAAFSGGLRAFIEIGATLFTINVHGDGNCLL